MLKRLHIKNYLLIEEIDLDFNPGFSVITGETGAGKSIILGALSLLLGKRADTDVLQNKETKCIVEGHFLIPSNKTNIINLFKNEDLDFDTDTIIRREIIPSGKSRAFINDTPVNLNTLKSISEKIINLHSQQENLALSVADYRMQIIDTAAETEDLLSSYKSNFSELKEVRKSLELEKDKLNKAKQDIDYFTFQIEQLESANLKDDNELEELEKQSGILENAEEIKLALSNSIDIIENENISIESLLRELKSVLGKIAGKYNSADKIIERLDSILIEIRDINAGISEDMEKAEINPELLETVNNRIDQINTLLTKHNAANISELKDKLEHYLSFIKGTESIESNIKDLETKLSASENKCWEFANNLSKLRNSIFSSTEKHIILQLKQLGMPDASFTIENSKSDTLKETGIDNINFLFSANKSGKQEILERVASGGEFSRLMLTLKSLLVKASGISTIIFDEIDTGVSGEIANKMGKIMQQISSQAQVISITHLPQVAALGDYHYKVYKKTKQNITQTSISNLNSDERITEIASMISGERMTVEAIENAKTLLNN